MKNNFSRQANDVAIRLTQLRQARGDIRTLVPNDKVRYLLKDSLEEEIAHQTKEMEYYLATLGENK